MTKKLVFICVAAALCVPSAVYGKAVRDANGVYAYNRSGDPNGDPNLGWHTINDWVKIGNTSYEDSNYAGQSYADYISLWSDTNVVEDSITDPIMGGPSWETTFEDRCDLIMYADKGDYATPYSVPVDTWCGYKWTVPDMNESIVSIQISGFSNFAPVFQELLVLDDANNVIGNYIAMPPWYPSMVNWLHSYPDYDPTGHYYYSPSLPQTPTAEFPVSGSKSVSLVYYMRGNWWPYPYQEGVSVWDHTAWGGNFFWIYLPRIRTVMDPQCGAGNDLPKPEGDINDDCKVDFEDYSQLAENWMLNVQYTAEEPTDDLQPQCGGGNDHLYPRLRPVGDLNSDCIIDLEDAARFVATWLVDNQ